MTSVPPPLHARLAEMVNYLTSARAQLVEFVEAVPERWQNTRGESDRWSVAEHLEHLAIVEDGSGRRFTKLIRELQSNGSPLETETSSLMSSIDQYDVEDSPRRIQAPPAIHPSGAMSAADALGRLAAARTRFMETIRQANGLDLTKVRGEHPLFGPIDGYQWLLFLAKHELRHLRHIRDTVQQLSTRSS